MPIPSGIDLYLDEVRRRRRLVHLFGDTGLFLAGAAALLLALVLLSGWLDRWRVVLRSAGVGLLGAAALAYIVRLVLVLRRLSSQRRVAELVGEARPRLRSDLLSTIELGDSATPSRFSPALVDALGEATERTLQRVPAGALVPSRMLRPAAIGLAAAVFGWAAAATLAPGYVSNAAASLFSMAGSKPDRVARRPLLGDLSLRYVYPPHVGRAPRVVDSSTGHISAPAGTRVELRTSALVKLRRATLVLRARPRDAIAGSASSASAAAFGSRAGRSGGSSSGSGGSGRSSGTSDDVHERRIQLAVVGGRKVSGAFVIRADGVYTFDVELDDARRLRDPIEHRVQIEPDARPLVTMHSPPSKIEVTARQRMELGYVARDDFGLRSVYLVHQIGDRKPRRRLLWKRAKGTRPRRASAKIEWDLAEVQLEPGVRVTYWIEAVDNDAVNGPKIGRSSPSYFKVFSPEERHQQVLAMQQHVLEVSLRSLSGRLLLFRGLPSAPAPALQLDKVRVAHRADARLLDNLRALAGRMRGDQLVSRTVLREIAGIDKRLHALQRVEMRALRALIRARQRRALKPHALAKVRKANVKHVKELERDTLLLSNLLDEQRLQNLVVLARQLEAAKKRLKELLARYRKTRSEALKREILREIEYMKRKLALLLKRMARLRSTIPDEYINAEALKSSGLADELSRLSKLLRNGNARSINKALSALERKLDALSGMLDKNLRGYRSARMSKRERAFAEMMDKLRGMEAEQRELARRTRRIVRSYQRRASKLMKDKIAPFIRRELKKLDKLRKKLRAINRRRLASYQQEQLDRIRKRALGLRRMLRARDLEQALNMAQRTENALKALKDDIAEDTEGRYGARRRRLRRTMKKAKRAQAAAAEIARDLESIFPEPSTMLQPRDRRELARLRQRQRALQRATAKLAKKLAPRKGGKAAAQPRLGGRKLPRSLAEAARMMRRAARKLRAIRPQEARSQQEGAADQLRRMQRDLKRARQPRMSGGRRQRERIKIPGAESFKPPKEFRQDILDAMKEKPPKRFKHRVKRYYRELVR